jgi:acyl-CoA reductase-like NAD-dependent aldehyde dehydrogenase
LTVGDGFGDNHLGPVQNELQYLRVRKFLEDIRDTHCKVAAGLENYETQNKPGPGYFVRPTIVDNPPDNSMIVKEEPFGMYINVLSTWRTGKA